MTSEKFNMPSCRWWCLKPWRLPLAPVQSFSSRMPSHLLLRVPVPLSWLRPGLTQSWCHCLCQALVPSCAFDPVLPWCHLEPSLMRLFERWDDAYTSPVWGFFLQAHCYKGQQVCRVKEIEEEAPGAFQPYQLITSITLGPIIGHLQPSRPLLRLGLHWVPKKLLDFIWNLCPTIIPCGQFSPRNCAILDLKETDSPYL